MKTIVKRIAVDRDFTAEFRLYPLYHDKGVDYEVAVTDRQGQPWLFRMKKNRYGHWKIVNAPKVPDWIISLEAKLKEAVSITSP